MKKFIDWHKEQMFWFMTKFNLGLYEVAWIAWFKGLLLGALLLLLCSCGVQLKTGYVDPIYNNCCDKDIILEVPDTVEIDTLSFSQLKWKLRTDFNFRWNFAQYAMNQPYSWYWNNPRLDGIWRPYNRFDVYFHSNWFWNNWAWNYPYNYYGWNNWYYPYHGSYSWYRPWHYQSYNVIWNASRRGNNVAYITGPRSSINIENTINNNRRVRTYPNRVNNNINNLVNEISRNNSNIRINNSRPNISINNSRPNYNINNSRPTYNIVKPNYNNNLNNYNSRTSINSSRSNSNSVRSSNNSSRGGINKGRN